MIDMENVYSRFNLDFLLFISASRSFSESTVSDSNSNKILLNKKLLVLKY
jgi:hypothetical protein